MPNYNESAIAGSQWQRCGAVVILNPYQSTPTIRMDEELIVDVGGEKFTKGVGSLNFPFNPAEVIQLIDPETGASLGQSMTAMQVYVALHSLYIAKAQARDQQA